MGQTKPKRGFSGTKVALTFPGLLSFLYCYMRPLSYQSHSWHVRAEAAISSGTNTEAVVKDVSLSQFRTIDG